MNGMNHDFMAYDEFQDGGEKTTIFARHIDERFKDGSDIKIEDKHYKIVKIDPDRMSMEIQLSGKNYHDNNKKRKVAQWKSEVKGRKHGKRSSF